MAGRGRPPKEKQVTSEPNKIKCLYCGQELNEDKFYMSNSPVYNYDGRLHHCKDCIGELYRIYVKKYKDDSYPNPECMAVQKMCMITDIYYHIDIVDSAIDQTKTKGIDDPDLMSQYFRMSKLKQNKDDSYDATIRDEFKNDKDKYAAIMAASAITTDRTSEKQKRLRKAEELFGSGFEDSDYEYLQDQYEDWTARHECKTKAQEELFKQICFTQLELLKYNRAGKDTKNLTATFQDLLGSAKLQPKQNTGDTTADTQTFGTLIDKWENTRPIPEIDEELRDVDNIGLYIDVFFRGHLSKMVGIKNPLSRLYDRYIKKYTVDKPEYNGEEDDDALFEAMFGSSLSEEDDEDV